METDRYVLTISSDMKDQVLGPPASYAETVQNAKKVLKDGGWMQSGVDGMPDLVFPVSRINYIAITPYKGE